MRATHDYSRILSVDTRDPLHPVEAVEYAYGDVRRPIVLKDIDSATEIYNFAAVHTTPGHEDWEYFWTNEWGAIHVCDFASAVGAKLLFFSSSISTYGSTESELDEQGPFEPTSAYGRSKLLAEAIHRSWQKSAADRRLRIVRPGVIFGQGERGNFTRLAAALKARRFFYPGRDDAIKSCGYVGELVRSALFTRDLPDAEITYNFAYPDRYTTREICTIFCRQANFKMPSVVIPHAVILGAGFAFEILAALGVKTSVNRARIRKLMLSTNIVPRKLAELGYHFETDLKEGIERWHAESQGRFE
jgi:nucleoside-diphosphate-sugar epimerase